MYIKIHKGHCQTPQFEISTYKLLKNIVERGISTCTVLSMIIMSLFGDKNSFAQQRKNIVKQRIINELSFLSWQASYINFLETQMKENIEKKIPL